MSDSSDIGINSATLQPEKTPLIIGPGILIRGHIIGESDDTDSRMMILGRVEGDITTKGIVQIAKGGVVCANSFIEAGEIIVSGTLTGEGVTVRTNLLILQNTGNVEVDIVSLPPGGLEQHRGGVLNARLDMSLPEREAAAVAPFVARAVTPAVSAFKASVSLGAPVTAQAAVAKVAFPASATPSMAAAVMANSQKVVDSISSGNVLGSPMPGFSLSSAPSSYSASLANLPADDLDVDSKLVVVKKLG